jgi:hypothetical protein
MGWRLTADRSLLCGCVAEICLVSGSVGFDGRTPHGCGASKQQEQRGTGRARISGRHHWNAPCPIEQLSGTRACRIDPPPSARSSVPEKPVGWASRGRAPARGTLVVTTDTAAGKIDAAQIHELITRLGLRESFVVLRDS